MNANDDVMQAIAIGLGIVVLAILPFFLLGMIAMVLQ